MSALSYVNTKYELLFLFIDNKNYMNKILDLNILHICTFKTPI
jgi:hypothetical protein